MYVAIDLEFNQPFDFKNNAPCEPHPDLSFEIIQVGLALLDSDLDIQNSLEINIRPTLYQRIHPFVGKITGITWSDLANCPTFPGAWQDILKFLSGIEEPIFAVWGGSDMGLLSKNLYFHGLSTDFISSCPTLNVQQLANKHFDTGGGGSIGLKTAVEQLGLTQELPFHCALSDAIYTARVLRALMRGQNNSA